MVYPPDRKAAVLARMLSEVSVSLQQLAWEEGISHSTLRRWRAEAVREYWHSSSGRDLKTEQVHDLSGPLEPTVEVEQPVSYSATSEMNGRPECLATPKQDSALSGSSPTDPPVPAALPQQVRAVVEDMEVSQPEERCWDDVPSKQSAQVSVLRTVFLYTLILMSIAILGVFSAFGYIWLDLKSKGVLKIPERAPGIMVLAADRKEISAEGAFHGDDVRLNALPQYVPKALIAIEDSRFRSHLGLDPVGVLRAAFANYQAGRVVQGGSTLTQQLAKNLFLTPDRTLTRKLQEFVLAVWLEVHCSKDEILELYLNRVYFGAGAFGIEEAAQVYFGKPAASLTLAEAAMLVGLLRAPSAYNPLDNPDAATERARVVLKRMLEAGFISAAEERTANAQPAKARSSGGDPTATQYIVDWIKEELPTLVGNVDQSVVVETTIDTNLQSYAEKSLTTQLAVNGNRLNVTQGAFVLMDSRGAIRALIGGKSYSESQFNRVTKARRQPGSAFKPFVYLTALEQGYQPGSIETDEPVKIGNWEPENYRRKYLGSVTLETALALSLNTIAAKLVVAVGAERVIATARRLGVGSPLTPTPSLALGTSEVTLLEMTGAFASFANGGHPVRPSVIRRVVTRDGRVIFERREKLTKPEISPQAVSAMNKMLSEVVSRGTGKRAQIDGFDIGGKTGTSQDYRDAWFIGYSADLVAGVWVGNDDNAPTRQVTGGAMPADIWRDVMSVALQDTMAKPLPATSSQDGTVAEFDTEAVAGEAAFAFVGMDKAKKLVSGENRRKPSKKQRSGTGFNRNTKPIATAVEGQSRQANEKRKFSSMLGRTSQTMWAEALPFSWAGKRLERPSKGSPKSGGGKCKRRSLFSLGCRP